MTKHHNLKQFGGKGVNLILQLTVHHEEKSGQALKKRLEAVTKKEAMDKHSPWLIQFAFLYTT